MAPQRARRIMRSIGSRQPFQDHPMTLPHPVTVVEVGARDGLQSEKALVPTEEKVRLLDLLIDAGFRRIEATSFVSPKHVPQMADAEEVLGRVKRPAGVKFEALVPNMRGLERALRCGLDRVSLFVSASETFNRENLRAGREASRAAAAAAAKAARAAGLKVRGAVVAGFGCPYEGRVPQEEVERLTGVYAEMGCDEVAVADTTGMANPTGVKRRMEALMENFPEIRFALHFHNTRGAGLANLLAGLEAGIDIFDAAVGGLGGCPFAPKATGNIATEDAANMLGEMGLATGLDLPKLLEAVAFAESLLGRQLPGQLLHAGIVDWDAPAA